MKLRMLEVFGVRPHEPMPCRILDLPSGARFELDVNEDEIRVLAPGPYAFAVGHVLEVNTQLCVDDLLFLARNVLDLPSAQDDGANLADHRELAERQLPRLAPFAAHALATRSAFLLVEPSSFLLPLLMHDVPAEVLAHMIEVAKGITAPLVAIMPRDSLADTIERASTAKGFETVAKGLRDPELGASMV
ncbi:MAG: hypothetical protein ABI134_07095, partial [Byssovorax sp.]